MKKKNVIIIGIIVLVLIASGGGYYWYTAYKKPYDNAVIEFNVVKKSVNQENEKLDTLISSAQKVLDSKETPYDKNTLKELQVAISQTEENKRKVPELPKKIKDIKTESNNLSAPLDYSEDIAFLESKKKAAEDSIKQYKQVSNPTGDFIVKRLGEIHEIIDIRAVTEDNDPNGKLNKQGGYTSATYFASKDVNQNEVFGNDLIEKGTDAGGCIEVYANVEDAKKRNDYLSAFDGGALSPGSHSVLGSIVVRISDELNATQQKELENIINLKLLELQ